MGPPHQYRLADSESRARCLGLTFKAMCGRGWFEPGESLDHFSGNRRFKVPQAPALRFRQRHREFILQGYERGPPEVRGMPVSRSSLRFPSGVGMNGRSVHSSNGRLDASPPGWSRLRNVGGTPREQLGPGFAKRHEAELIDDQQRILLTASGTATGASRPWLDELVDQSRRRDKADGEAF